MISNKLQELEIWFNQYCRAFGQDDAEAGRNYELKQLHTLKVRDTICLLAEAAGLAEDGVALAAVRAVSPLPHIL
jgi:hypothetical protein